MKILFLIRALNTSGAQRQLVNLAIGLKSSGFEVVVATMYEDRTRLWTELEKSSITIVSLKKKHRWDILSFFFNLCVLIKKEQPDIVHGYLGVPNNIIVFLKPLFKNLKIVWGVRNAFHNYQQYDHVDRLSYRLECFLSRFADLIIANSEAGYAHAVASGFPQERTVVIPNGIDSEAFQPDPGARDVARKSWGINEKQVAVGIVARIDPMKDYPNFLRALSKVGEEDPEVIGICVGRAKTDVYKAEMIDLANTLGLQDRILWLGERQDMLETLNGLDILVSSSGRGEGFSNSIAEAMACGVPCAVTNVGDAAKIVGDCGIVVKPKDSRELAAGIMKMVSKVRSDGPLLAACNRDRIVSCFSIAKMVNRTAEQLEKLQTQTHRR